MMGQEIERKFLVIGDGFKTVEPVRFCQGYLNSDKNRTVRIRLAGDSAWLTIKGLNVEMTRPEFEYEIPVGDVHQLLAMCETPLIEKNRFVVEYADYTWEVDEFFGENVGLVVAEIELKFESELFEIPDWIGSEVTGDSRYYNSNLIKNPYWNWRDDA